MWLQSTQAHANQRQPDLCLRVKRAYAGVCVCFGFLLGSKTGMTCRGQRSDLLKLIFGLAAELLISYVSFNEARLPSPVSWICPRTCLLVYSFVFNPEINRTLSGCLGCVCQALSAEAHFCMLELCFFHCFLRNDRVCEAVKELRLSTFSAPCVL